MSEDKQIAPVFSGRPYHLALGKELQYFPDYVCTQTSAAGKLCNPARGGVGARDEGLEGSPTLHPAAFGPRRRGCSPRGPAFPTADGLHHGPLAPPPPPEPLHHDLPAQRQRSAGVSRSAGVINGLFIKRPDQNAYIRQPGNLITEPGFTSHTHTPFFFEASVRS